MADVDHYGCAMGDCNHNAPADVDRAVTAAAEALLVADLRGIHRDACHDVALTAVAAARALIEAQALRKVAYEFAPCDQCRRLLLDRAALIEAGHGC